MKRDCFAEFTLGLAMTALLLHHYAGLAQNR